MLDYLYRIKKNGSSGYYLFFFCQQRKNKKEGQPYTHKMHVFR